MAPLTKEVSNLFSVPEWWVTEHTDPYYSGNVFSRQLILLLVQIAPMKIGEQVRKVREMVGAGQLTEPEALWAISSLVEAHVDRWFVASPELREAYDAFTERTVELGIADAYSLLSAFDNDHTEEGFSEEQAARLTSDPTAKELRKEISAAYDRAEASYRYRIYCECGEGAIANFESTIPTMFKATAEAGKGTLYRDRRVLRLISQNEANERVPLQVSPTQISSDARPLDPSKRIQEVA